MVPKHFLPAFWRKTRICGGHLTNITNKQAGKDNAHQGCSAKKRFGNAPKKLATLKLLQLYFKAKHEKGVGTPFPRVPAPLYLWCTPPISYGFKICEMSTHSAGAEDICETMWLFLMSTHLVHPCTPHQVGTPLGNSGTPWGVRYTRLTSTVIYYRDHFISTILFLIESYLTLSYVLP